MANSEAWREQAAEREAARQKQTDVLAAFGFGPAWSIASGTWGGVYEFATCETCGAAVNIVQDPEAKQPVATHKAWHDRG